MWCALEVAQEVRDQLVEVNRVTEAASRAYTDVHNAKAGLIITERYARELMLPASRLEELGSQYAAKLAELGAGIDAQLELVGDDTGPLDDKTRAEMESLIHLVPVAENLANQLEELVGAAAPLVRMSRSLRAPIRHLRSGLQGAVDGRKTISEWGLGAAEAIKKREESPEISD